MHEKFRGSLKILSFEWSASYEIDINQWWNLVQAEVNMIQVALANLRLSNSLWLLSANWKLWFYEKMCFWEERFWFIFDRNVFALPTWNCFHKTLINLHVQGVKKVSKGSSMFHRMFWFRCTLSTRISTFSFGSLGKLQTCTAYAVCIAKLSKHPVVNIENEVNRHFTSYLN